MKEAVITEYRYHGIGETDKTNRLFDTLSIDTLLDAHADSDQKDFCKSNDFAFYASGWQSWGFGGELKAGQKQSRYIPLIPQWEQYVSVPGTKPKKVKSKKLLEGCFFIYLRWNNGGRQTYLAIASVGNSRMEQDAPALPPVAFYVDRKKRTVTCVACSQGKSWKNNECIAKLAVFTAGDFFALKDQTRSLFAKDREARFGRLAFLNTRKDKSTDAPIRIGGWESWYNHYANINHELIEGDLAGLGSTENLIKTCLLDQKKPCVFQVDDGWEQALGDWDARSDRFPGGMTKLASAIADKGYIPGLWMAPFIVDWRSAFARSHRDWILRDKRGKPVAAGMNLLWGAALGKDQPAQPYSYFCLDISRNDVLAYLDSLMERAINEWGFRYLKLDFLFAGMLTGAHQKGGAAYQWYQKAVETLTSRACNNKGQPVAYLGCGMPFEASFNAFPLSRIGPDTKEDWDVDWLRKAHFAARTSAFANMQSTLGHAFWDNSVYINDPDVVFLRYTNISLSDKEKMLVALVNHLFASQLMHSDDPVNFDGEKEGAFTKKITELYRLFDSAEFGLVNVSSTSYRLFSRDGRWCGCINLGEEPVALNKTALAAGPDGSPAEDCSLEPVVEFASKIGEEYSFEAHSISLYKRI